MIKHAMLMVIRHTNVARCKMTCQPIFGAPLPTNSLPFFRCQQKSLTTGDWSGI
ncbi:hypothetical protein B932_3195 [Gluconobacter oxydans H24]|nr:hypothetical protein B932_3195 [Gluconobacter oxydans H24]